MSLSTCGSTTGRLGWHGGAASAPHYPTQEGPAVPRVTAGDPGLVPELGAKGQSRPLRKGLPGTQPRKRAPCSCLCLHKCSELAGAQYGSVRTAPPRARPRAQAQVP